MYRRLVCGVVRIILGSLGPNLLVGATTVSHMCRLCLVISDANVIEMPGRYGVHLQKAS